jgi:signal transduction histidine kinase
LAVTYAIANRHEPHGFALLATAAVGVSFIAVRAGRKRERELRLAAAEAQRASSRTAQYLQAVSHELRAPLVSIVGFAEVPTSARADSLADEVRNDYLHIIADNGRQLQDLSRRIADLSRFEQGTLRLVEQGIDAAELAEVAAGLCQGAAEAADVTIVVHVLDAIEIHVDVARLRRVLAVLIRTAIDGSQAGGAVTVSVEIAEGGDLCFKVGESGGGQVGEAVAGSAPSPSTESGPDIEAGGVAYLNRQIALLHGGAELIIPARRVSGRRRPAHQPAACYSAALGTDRQDR